MTIWWNIYIIMFIYRFMSLSELFILSLILFSYLVIMSGWFSKYIFYCNWADLASALNCISFYSIGLPFLKPRTWAILYIYHEVLEVWSLHGPRHPWKWKLLLAFPLYPFPFLQSLNIVSWKCLPNKILGTKSLSSAQFCGKPQTKHSFCLLIEINKLTDLRPRWI